MNVLMEIHRRKSAHEVACGNRVAPTIYAGRKQMDAINREIERFPNVKGEDLTGTFRICGMPLVAVVADDYLRVA